MHWRIGIIPGPLVPLRAHTSSDNGSVLMHAAIRSADYPRFVLYSVPFKSASRTM